MKKSLFLGVLACMMTVTAIAAPKPLPSIHVEGKWLVDTYGNHVVLHGVMDTPSMYFNNNRWGGGYNETGAVNCRKYFNKIFGALEQSNCDVFRLHLDPAWTSDGNITAPGFTKNTAGKTVDPIGQVVENEADISHFSSARLSTFLKSVYIPLMMDALDHGLYVVVRPPGVCPGEIRVDGYYQKYLIEVWDSVSKNDIIKSHAGQISIELANEPVSVKNSQGNDDKKALRDFFQPIVNKIRANGFTGIIWVPGAGWQASYADYATYPIEDVNFGYAVHDYDGWYGCEDKKWTPADVPARTQAKITQFHNQVPVVDTNPIIITEIDWSPKNPGSGHYNEHGEWVESNYGTWATGRTSVWGQITKNVHDHYGNISMTLSGTHCLLDVDTLIQKNKVVPSFGGLEEACGKACMDWYAEYAKVDNPKLDYVCDVPLSDLGNGKFKNPVVRADFPDPDVIRVNDTYYMVSTTMSLFPGATILKSKDMVNWEYCAQPLQQLATSDRYNLTNGQDAYAGGMWAASMKYYDGKFYILINGSDTGFWLLTAENPEGTWQKKKLDHNYYDPGMLFDNGKVYVACGAGKIRVCELDLNFNFIQEKEVIDRSGTQLEGCHFYKKGNYYYIYATYAGWPDQQVVFRSKDIFGPYEEKQVLEQFYDNTPNLIHQGSLLQDVKGNWWTIMQEDLGSLGRFPNLQPVKWVNDWPVVGNNGTPYKSFVDEITKPATSDDYYLAKAMATTDNFRSYPLGMQWEWNHNPDNNNWSLFDRAGWLRLKTNSVVSSLPQARNMLTQRIFINKDKATTGTVRLDGSRLNEGDRAGICIFQDPYAAIALEMKNGKHQLVWFQDQVKNAGSSFSPSEKTQAVELTDNIVYLRAAVKHGDNKAYFYYSTDGTTWERLGGETQQSFNLTVFFGARFGLFCYSTQTSGGCADFDWFSTENTYDEEGMYGEIKTPLDENKFTVSKIAASSRKIEAMVGSFCSPGITATFLDKHTENVTTMAIYEPETEGIVDFRGGQMVGVGQGSTNVNVLYTDAFGNTVNTSFTANSSYFPLDAQYITTDIVGTNTYTKSTGYGTFKFSEGGEMGWVYPTPVDMSEYKYLVVKLRTKQTADAHMTIYTSTNMKGPFCATDPFGDETQIVVDLTQAKYTSMNRKGNKVNTKSIYKITFTGAKANRSMSVNSMFLSNDSQYDPTGVVDLTEQPAEGANTDIYTLSGQQVRKSAGQNLSTRGLKSGLYIVGRQKVIVNNR